MWIFVQRLSLFLVTVLAGDQLFNRFLQSHEIKSNKIYSLDEVAEMFKLEKGIILQLIKRKDIKAREVNGKYMILGEKIKEFLNE